VVVPGQDSPTHTDVLDRLFAPKSVPMGIIHVVSAGYDWVWETNNRELIADRFESEAKGRAIAVAEFASRVEKAGPPASEDVRLLAKLQELQGQSPSWHLRTEFQKSEFERFRTLCQDHLQSTWGEANGGKQIWLIIAVSKSDLWYDDRETLKSYYIPSATGDGDSPFSAELRELVSVVGASRLSRIAVLPVASYPRHYRFSRYFGEQRPVLDAQQTESLLNNFRNMVGEFCGNRKI